MRAADLSLLAQMVQLRREKLQSQVMRLAQEKGQREAALHRLRSHQEQAFGERAVEAQERWLQWRQTQETLLFEEIARLSAAKAEILPALRREVARGELLTKMRATHRKTKQKIE